MIITYELQVMSITHERQVMSMNQMKLLPSVAWLLQRELHQVMSNFAEL